MRRAARAYCLLTTKHYSLLTAFFLLAIHHLLVTFPARAQGVGPNSIITTVAGNGRVFRGDGGPATSAAFGGTGTVAVDSAGNVYTTDGLNNLVLKITPDGVIRVVAGNNIRGYSGDDGPATSASLNLSTLQGSGIGGLAVDAAGNLYISDTLNHRIRKVSPQGVISTIAGDGRQDFSGDGGPAANARFNNPAGLLLDRAGNLYIADFSNQRIRKVGTDGIITTVAGNGRNTFSGDGGSATSASLNGPTSVALDASGNLYIADRSNFRVRKVGPDGIITTVGGNGVNASLGDGGLAANASFTYSLGVAVDEIGNWYIAEGGRIRKVTANGIISTVAGGGNSLPGDGGPATRAAIGPSTVVVVAGTLYIGEGGRVRKVAPDGIITTIAGTGLANFSGDGGPAHLAALSGPQRLAMDAAGTLYIADEFNNRVRKLSANGTITTAAGNGSVNFSGDAGPATSAALNHPRGVALDATGNLYIVDSNNSRIRKVDGSGKIITVAGGRFGFSGDGGPAIAAGFNNPEEVAVDAVGNLYIADRLNYRIRKVDLAGVIRTVAGNGNIGFSGDGGPAVNASLNAPSGVALDASGNLYIADSGNSRIRKVSPDGIIRTVAGGGTLGDGVPATSARFDFPTRVTVDLAGNLFIVDLGRHEIRKVSPDGVISTIAGSRISGFLGDGGPARNAFMNYPNGLAVDQAGNIYVSDSGNDRVRVVLASPPSFAVAPASLTFTAQAGSGQVLPQRITVSGAVIGLAWTAQVTTQSGGNWLSVSPLSGTLPSVVGVTVNVANLAPGNYRGTVTIVASLAAAPIQPVAVTLTVEAPLPAKLAVEPGSLTLDALVGANAPARTLRFSNAGGGSLAWTARTETSSGGNWLSIAPASGSVSASAPNQAQVTASSSTLAAGVYSGAVIVSSSTTNETLRVPVNLLVSQSRQTMLLSQSGLLFTGVEGGGVIPSQTFGVLNTGEGVMIWTAQASTLSGGGWLTVTPREGATDAASLQVPLVEVGVSVAGLAAGAYSGQIRVSAPTANNSPQLATVILNVLPRGSNPGVLVRPTGLIFAAQAGTSSPSSQTVNLSAITPGSVDIVSGLLTTDGGDWIEALPRNLTLSTGDATRRIVVQPSLGSFDPGVYRGALTLLPRDGSPPQVVTLLFLVVRQTGASPARGALSGLLEPQSHTACVPAQLFATHRTLGTSFASPVGWPSTIEAQVADDCGHAVPNATVVARFSNGDPQVVLTSLRNGIYVGTWSPATPAAQVVVTVRAELPPLAPAEATAQGSAAANAAAPAVFAGGIVNTASYGSGEGLAPGSIVSVFGRNLARGENRASQLPLETSLGGARLSIGGVDVPLLYAGEGQINAQLPFDLPPNTRQVVVIQTARENGAQAYAVPETITVTSARPAIFSVNQQGAGQGTILNQNSSLNSASNPAARGSVIQVFATGLGATNPVVSSGQPAPGNPPALVTTAAEASIGGQPAGVQFAGLAPGFVGLYQVNVVVPASIQPGSEVELTLTQNGVPSNTVTVAIQ